MRNGVMTFKACRTPGLICGNADTAEKNELEAAL